MTTNDGETVSLFYQTGSQMPFTSMEVDGVETSVDARYTFVDAGEHTVKFTLADPTIIGGSAFYERRSLTSIYIPDSVTSIGDFAFYECSSLTSVTIPDSVTSIATNAFYGCTSLTSIVCNATTAPTIDSSTFLFAYPGSGSGSGSGSGAITQPGTLYVPSGSSGYDTWMQNADYYLGLYGWTISEQ